MNAQATASSTPDEFLLAVAALPRLPKVIRYEDDYCEKIRSLDVGRSIEVILLHNSGAETTLRLDRLDPRVRPLIRVFLLLNLQVMAAASVRSYFRALIQVAGCDIEEVAMAQPLRVKTMWPGLIARYSAATLIALRRLLTFLCEVRFASWTPLHEHFVSTVLPVHTRGAYSTVRSGDAFLAIEEEARLVRWIDAAALEPAAMNKRALELTCLVVASYQFGMRPKQLGVARKRDCSVRISSEDHSAIVRVNFRMIKQKDATLSRLPLLRKVKREWAHLFVELMKHKAQDEADSFLFGFPSRNALSVALIAKLDEILPDGGRVAYDLRHSLAQRLVDAGAGHEELASAMGHSRLSSGLVYFRASANQAELVNKAMGASDTYVAVARIASERFITADDLAALKGDQQIAGVPHGIPIAGIGGCRTGQPSCPYNPVAACYGCPKFMPVRDQALHERVLSDFRGVVRIFLDAARGDASSPAYLQLQRTISEVQGVILQLKGAGDE